MEFGITQIRRIMKDITIKSKDIRRELIIWLLLLGISFGLNIYSIIKYQSQWSELYSSLGFVIAISCTLYIAIAIIRLFYWVILKIVRRS